MRSRRARSTGTSSPIRTVYNTDLASIKLEKLRKRHLLKWRAELEDTPAAISRSYKTEKLTRPRSPATVNRDLVPLRAALNLVLAPGKPNTELDWQIALKPAKNAAGRRMIYLDREQRMSLLDNCISEIYLFVKALCLLPIRPGAMSLLNVGDFNPATNELRISRDKNKGLRIFQVSLKAAEVILEATNGRSSAEPMFVRANGTRWNKDSWKKPIATAAEAARLPQGVTAYTLRHSVITDLVNTKLPLLTIAQIAGTGVPMIERHYGHLISDAAREALDSLSL